MRISMEEDVEVEMADHAPDSFSVKSPRESSHVNASSTMISILLPPVMNRSEYIEFDESRIVSEILEEDEDPESANYLVEFADLHTALLPYETIIELENGVAAVKEFLTGLRPRGKQPSLISTYHRARDRPDKDGSVTLISSDDESTATRLRPRKRQLGARRGRRNSLPLSRAIDNSSSDSHTDSSTSHRRRTLREHESGTRPNTRHTRRMRYDTRLTKDEESSSAAERFELQSDLHATKRKRKMKLRLPDSDEDSTGTDAAAHSMRRSGRSTRTRAYMAEHNINDVVYRSDSTETSAQPKAIGAREIFQPLPITDPFVLRHTQQCQTCGTRGSNAHGQLIYCQGCSVAYHRGCIGHRSSRDHLVTKVGNEDFVLQCRRCISQPRRKDPLAPDQGMCQSCRKPGHACRPFRKTTTVVQEQRDREANGGEDPIVQVDGSRINQPKNVLFRCLNCWRAFHLHHLLPKDEHAGLSYENDDEIAERRFQEYSQTWTCNDCDQMPAKVDGLVAWKPVDLEKYVQGQVAHEVSEDDKEYLIKWDKLSYFRSEWRPGAWVWGVTAAAMRSAFAKRDNYHNLPKATIQDAIPEEYFRVDIVLDVKFTSKVDTRVEEVDKARIREVDQAYIKYKGLPYEDAVWEKPPEPQDTERWSDFVSAYDDWVQGRYVKMPKSGPLKQRLEKARSTDFANLEKKKQPVNLVGGELMKYQLDGVNWLYYQWHQEQNAILADEMGLGKTIQIIGILATLVEDLKCFPFLVVVPNSTCMNWKREVKKWAPGLRVVTYYGTATARSKAYSYELYPEDSKELRCHLVVTSYEAAIDDTCRRSFRSVPWQGLIVDEGHRLKNDKNQLYTSLGALKIPFRILLTGTPLQNNARELFNLLQFLNDDFDAAALELEYTELTKENIPKLHDMIRPYFLRRTKAQVLTFLPAMAQIILPVSMSVLQKQLYQSILAKNPNLIRAIFDTTRSINRSERSNLNNILMQLRKCLCHPFVYSKDIEDRTSTATLSHRNLVDASAKLQLLELLLPKLKQREHRVLIFSQFLDMLDIVEDFLDGLNLTYQRLDGTISSLQKQKRIDEFNAPESPLSAFLLSTRSGGVGINLATADTVIILDPDFNPHQDIQALSRAHRIGQKKKVLCFQLMTRASAEEKIVQIGRKKMALDHVLIEQMDAEDDNQIDLESILRFGAAEILQGDGQDIRYDDASVEKLLDRSQIEDTKSGNDNTAETQFSFARVWENDNASLMDSLGSSDEEQRAPDPSVWDKILKERARIAAEEAASRTEALGRGKRTRTTVDYSKDPTKRGKTAHDHDHDDEDADDGIDDGTPVKATADPNSTAKTGGKGKQSRWRDNVDSDTDFQPAESDGNESLNDEMLLDKDDLLNHTPLSKPSRSLILTNNDATNPDSTGAQATKASSALSDQFSERGFKRAHLNWSLNATQPPQSEIAGSDPTPQVQACLVCGTWHQIGYCPLKIAGPEYCNLCGLAHYGLDTGPRICPHIRSETQVRLMLHALKQSTEPKHLVDAATKYLRGVKGNIVAEKSKRLQANAMKAAETKAQNLPLIGSAGQGQQISQAGTGEGNIRPALPNNGLDGRVTWKTQNPSWMDSQAAAQAQPQAAAGQRFLLPQPNAYPHSTQGFPSETSLETTTTEHYEGISKHEHQSKKRRR